MVDFLSALTAFVPAGIYMPSSAALGKGVDFGTYKKVYAVAIVLPVQGGV